MLQKVQLLVIKYEIKRKNRRKFSTSCIRNAKPSKNEKKKIAFQLQT